MHACATEQAKAHRERHCLETMAHHDLLLVLVEGRPQVQVPHPHAQLLREVVHLGLGPLPLEHRVVHTMLEGEGGAVMRACTQPGVQQMQLPGSEKPALYACLGGTECAVSVC